MAKKWTHTAAYKHFGTKPKNVQWSWSARSDDGKTVVVTLWQDRFKRRNNHLSYESLGFDPGNPDTRPGFRELMENLTWAQSHCGGQFKVITAIAKDITAEPRSIQECFPTKMVMRLTHLDVTKGAYSAEVVDS
jgi:hypothetical protein